MKFNNITKLIQGINKRNLVFFILLILAIILVLYINKSNSAAYRTVKILRGNIESLVNVTGTIEPINKAEISPKISGTIKDILVDYDSTVKKGDILAVIDPIQIELNVKEAKANVIKGNADFEHSSIIFESNKKLYKKNLISKEELNNSKVLYSSALAIKEQSDVTLQKSETDLINTNITSPIDGIVIGKNIIKGQSVSDRLDQRPVFTIARNLNEMYVIAPVSEIDIGKLKEGNKVTFGTDAYPDETHNGYIKQIVSEPNNTNNIVTYDVIIQFHNDNNKLKPGMTANVEILTASRKDALIIPKVALRFIPPSEDILESKLDINSNDKIIWKITRNKKLKPVYIETGLNNTTHIEIVKGDIKENDKIVIEYMDKTKSKGNSVGPLKIPGVKRF